MRAGPVEIRWADGRAARATRNTARTHSAHFVDCAACMLQPCVGNREAARVRTRTTSRPYKPSRKQGGGLKTKRRVNSMSAARVCRTRNLLQPVASRKSWRATARWLWRVVWYGCAYEQLVSEFSCIVSDKPVISCIPVVYSGTREPHIETRKCRLRFSSHE